MQARDAAETAPDVLRSVSRLKATPTARGWFRTMVGMVEGIFTHRFSPLEDIPPKIDVSRRTPPGTIWHPPVCCSANYHDWGH